MQQVMSLAAMIRGFWDDELNYELKLLFACLITYGSRVLSHFVDIGILE
jgi:hypothetical protein